MLLRNQNAQIKYESVCIEDLGPQEHLLRKIDEFVDFEFITELCAPYYCTGNGRPVVQPKIMYKLLFLGYLYGIRSKTRLVEEVKCNMSYRWFLGYGLTGKTPDVSVIWQNQRRRFKNTDVPQQIFDNIVNQAIDKGLLVDSEILYTDSTHLKANPNKNRFVKVSVHRKVKHYMRELDMAVAEDRRKQRKEAVA